MSQRAIYDVPAYRVVLIREAGQLVSERDEIDEPQRAYEIQLHKNRDSVTVAPPLERGRSPYDRFQQGKQHDDTRHRA